MATIRSGEQDVLLVIDAQRGVLDPSWERDRVVAGIATAIDRARAAGVPVVWVQHHDEEIIRGEDAWQLVPELHPAEDEPLIEKEHPSSFEATGLEGLLADLGATRLAIVGGQTNWCVRATSYGALDRGYDLVLVKDAHSTEDIEFESGEVVTAKSMVDDLNVTMRWISFPGRTSTTSAAAELYA